MQKISVGAITWVSLIQPSKKDLEALKDEFPTIHPIVFEELAVETRRPHVEFYDTHLYVVLHFPNFVKIKNKIISHEIDFILLHNTLITVQYAPMNEMPVLVAVQKEITKDADIAKQYGKSPIYLLDRILYQHFSFSLRELGYIQEKIDELEEQIFSGREKEILYDIALLKRDTLDFRRAMKPQQLTLESLVEQGSQMFGERMRPILKDLVAEYLKVWNLLENNKETLDALYDTNDSLLSAKTNENLRMFTILAFITFIPTVIASVYGMNLAIPLSTHPYAFWIVLLEMLGIISLVYIILKWKKLL